LPEAGRADFKPPSRSGAHKRVLVADGGPRRNARADHMNNFVS